MICDVHTHIWERPEQLGAAWTGLGRKFASARSSRQKGYLGGYFGGDGGTAGGGGGGYWSRLGLKWTAGLGLGSRSDKNKEDPTSAGAASSLAFPIDMSQHQGRLPAGEAEYHAQQTEEMTQVFVLGFRSLFLGANVPNEYIAAHVAKEPGKRYGFAGIDPMSPDAGKEFLHATQDLKLHGIVLSPALQDYHPSHTRAMAIYEMAQAAGTPVIIHHPGPDAVPARLDYARPGLWDEVLREYPKLRVVFTHMGWPWVDETLLMLARHPCAYADLAGISRIPARAHQALMDAVCLGVTEKLLFGSDFPFMDIRICLQAVYSINAMVLGTEATLIPRQVLRDIVSRDAAAELGLINPDVTALASKRRKR